MLVFTNKRLQFIGSKENKQILLGRILSVETYSIKGIRIVKNLGKNPHLEFQENIQIVEAMLNKILDNYSQS